MVPRAGYGAGPIWMSSTSPSVVHSSLSSSLERVLLLSLCTGWIALVFLPFPFLLSLYFFWWISFCFFFLLHCGSTTLTVSQKIIKKKSCKPKITPPFNHFSSGPFIWDVVRNFLLQDHIGQCSKFPILCPNSCGASIPREMVRLSFFFLSFPLLLKPTVAILLLDVLDELNGQFPLWEAPAGNQGSCIHYLDLDICFDEYNNHDSLQRHLIEGMDHIGMLGIGLEIAWNLG